MKREPTVPRSRGECLAFRVPFNVYRLIGELSDSGRHDNDAANLLPAFLILVESYGFIARVCVTRRKAARRIDRASCVWTRNEARLIPARDLD